MRGTMVRNIIWDVDGTLLDTYPAIVRAFLQVLHAREKTVAAERIYDLARIGLSHCATVLAAASGLPVEQVAEGFHETYGAMSLDDQGPFAGAADVCRAILARGGANVIVTHRGRASTCALLARHGMEDLFSGIVSADDGYAKKPDPAGFRAVMVLRGLEAEATIAVGDRDIDVRAAQAAGLRTVLYGATSSEAGPDLAIAAYSELIPALTARGLW